MSLQEAEQLLRSVFGYNQFRPSQRQVIQSLLDGQDAFGIMPTAGGKSLCYQIPALLWDGITLVISPLISLMKDQVDALRQLGVAAAYINSSLSRTGMNQRIQAAKNGQIKLLYVAPERLESASFIKALQSLSISLVAIDEAHCISTWGHDFRPSYRLIPSMIGQLQHKPQMVALTATATGAVQQDIAQLLCIPKDQIYLSSFERENLFFQVVKQGDKKEFIRQYLQKKRNQAGIIYTSSRRTVEEVAEAIKQQGITVAKYHAGMDDTERNRAQEQFSYDQVQVMVATNAFGMGIDKSNIRFVIHYHMPRDLESYYQEAGRAGRDGLASECVLLFQPRDANIHHYFIKHSQLDEQHRWIEHQKVREMEAYGRTHDCLTAAILAYFGETVDQTCGRCINCYQREHVTKQDCTVDAQKIFSCIKRMKERFGLSMVAKVLVGSQSKPVRQFQLDRLSTYGLLNQYTQKRVMALCQLLHTDGYIRLDSPTTDMPIASLTQKAVEVLQGTRKVFLYEETMVEWTETEGIRHERLFTRLRELRKELSATEKVPPYAIFHDSVLKLLSEHLPTSETEMLAIRGVGEQKFHKYGERFLSIIRQYCDELKQGENQETRPTKSYQMDQLRKQYRRAYKAWTSDEEQKLKQQFLAGMSIESIATKLGRQPGGIRSRLIRLGLMQEEEA